jgi:16S rRNA U516 pseudouridylate synthase RsuA-like enzyme
VETAEAGAEGLRINKALSAAGLGSRRAVEELVRAGRVAINGEVVREMGRRVDLARDRVEVDGSRVVLQPGHPPALPRGEAVPC